MKVQIKVTGGIMGIGKIVSKMNLYSERKKGMFHSTILEYDTLTDAKKDIAKAYKKLKEELKDEGDSETYLAKDSSHLSYDSSYATINVNI